MAAMGWKFHPSSYHGSTDLSTKQDETARI
jgi:hypothetical protein